MEAWEAIAREAIRDLVARYNASGDSGRHGELVGLFTPDALLSIDELGDFRGRDGIYRMLGSVSERDPDSTAPAHIRHFTATHQIDVDSKTAAHGRCYYQVLTEQGLDHWGRYLDRYVLQDGRWLFAERRVTVDGKVPGSWAERNLDRLSRG